MAEELLAEEGLTENIITLINELKLNVQINVYYFKLIPRKECNLVFLVPEYPGKKSLVIKTTIVFLKPQCVKLLYCLIISHNNGIISS